MNRFIKINLREIIFLFILSSVVFFRVIILQKFGFQYTDNDQAIMLQGLIDYSNGVFHEPRFYGQDYNSMIEAFFAVPLYKLGISAHKSIPIITSILSLFPFLLLTVLTYLKKSKFNALLILSILLLLPIEYSLITTIPRGFVTGIFISSFGLISLFYPTKKWSFLLIGFVSIIGFSINANSALISIPCLLYLFIINLKQLKFYIFTGVGLLLSGTIHYWIKLFYIDNPDVIKHSYSISYSSKILFQGISNLDRFLNYNSPILWEHGFIILILLLIIGIYSTLRKNLAIGVFITSFVLLIFLTLGINKIHDGTDSIFFSSARMYLAFPILISVCLSFIKDYKSSYKYLYFIFPAVCLIYKLTILDISIENHIQPTKNHIVEVISLDELNTKCNDLNRICKENKVGLIVHLDHHFRSMLAYGCKGCIENFPITFLTDYDRRKWRREEESKNITENILILDGINSEWDNCDNIEIIKSDFSFNVYLVTNNELTTLNLLEGLGMKFPH